MNTPKILVVGSFVMDLIVTTTKFPVAGETVLGTEFRMASGGKGANQAVQAARLGANVTMVGCVGNDSNGQAMLNSLKNDGVDVSHVAIHSELPSAVGHVQIETHGNGKAENRIIVVPGANFGIRKENVAFLRDKISSYDFVILQHEIPTEVNSLVAEYAYNARVPVMLNPAPAAPIPADIYEHITYISPNETEMALLLGVSSFAEDSSSKIASATNNAYALKKKCGVKNVLVTLGSSGSLLLDDEKSICVPAVPCQAQDPTAAGDSYVAAFCYGLSCGLSKEDSMSLASATASITVSKYGAQPSLPNRNSVLELLQTIGMNKLANLLKN